MSTLGDIENAIVNKLQAIQVGGEAVFQTVRGFMVARDVKYPEALLRERMPAAYVSVRSLFVDPESYHLVRYVGVFVAVRNMRSQEEARHGGDDGPGLFTLIESANGQLDGAAMPGGTVSYVTGASMVLADANTLVVRMTYAVS
jgi:hypothetical protein